MLGPIMIINFINRIRRIYRHASIDKELDNYYFKNMLQISQNSTEHVFDGYPLVLVMFHMVHNCASLIDVKTPRQNKKLISQQKSTLEMVCKRYFGNNVYLALNEVFFHLISIFIISWRFGFSYFAAQFDWLITQLRQKQPVYLYRQLFATLYEPGVGNTLNVKQFNKALS